MIDLFGESIEEKLKLEDKYFIVPSSEINTRGIKWQNKKRFYKGLGIEAEIMRDTRKDKSGAGDLGSSFKSSLSGYSTIGTNQTVSIFDPVLCHVMYQWFCPMNGLILDPFAGGGVRGIVANYLGYKYTGIELRQEQVDANRISALNILPVNNQPQWYCGDSNKILNDNFNTEFDFLFSCPPYGNLEIYSDLPDDISNMSYDCFMEAYRSIIKKSCNNLKSGCFACFVVSEFRDKKGNYYGFVSDTIQSFKDCGMNYFNEMILLNPVGTKCLTMEIGFKASRKVGRVHQNILVFKKN